MQALSTAHPAITALQQQAQRHAVDDGLGGQVVWRRFGTGTGLPLVLLHGGHGSWLHWARNIDALAAAHTLWLPDLPGYGDSSTPREPTLAALLQGLRHTLDTLLGAHTPIALAGFSFGGLVAAHLAVQRPGVQRLALLGPAGHGSRRRPRGALQPWRAALEAGDAAALQQVMRHNLLMHMLAGDEADPLALAVHTTSCLATRFRSKGISLAGGLGACLQQLTAPVLLAWGEHDVTADPEAQAQALPALCPQARAEVLPGAGHWVQYQAAERVNALLLGWLGALSPT